MRLTKELIEKGRNGTGGYNKKQLKILGVPWPPPKGWIERLVDEDMAVEDYNRFLDARYGDKTPQLLFRAGVDDPRAGG